MLMKRSPVLFQYLALFLAMAAPAALPAGSLGTTHVDKETGFSIRVPKDWKFVASPDSERYIVGKFIGERELWSRTSGRARYAHTPEMRIIVFSPENSGIREEKSSGTLLGKEITVVARQNPYRDFKEYTKRNKKGFYFGEEKKDRIRGIDCTWIEVVMEQRTPPSRQLACIFHLDDMDVAVSFEIMDEWYSKYERLFCSSCRSFKKVKRTVKKTDSGSSIDEKPKSRKEFVKSVASKLPKGWVVKETKNYLVISHTGKRFTQKIAAFAETVHKAIEKDYSGMAFWSVQDSEGNGTGVTMPIIRICADYAERNAYVDNSRGHSVFNADASEIVIHDGMKEGRSIEYTMQRLARGLHARFVAERFGLAIPHPWYNAGKQYYYYVSYSGGGSRGKYKKDPWDVEFLRDAVRGGDCRSFRTLICHESTGLSYEESIKLGTLFCFLQTRKGMKKPWKGVTGSYLENIEDAYIEFSARAGENVENYSEDGSSGKQKKDKGKKKGLTVSIEEIRKEAVERTFASWTDEDWKRLEAAWQDWAL